MRTQADIQSNGFYTLNLKRGIYLFQFAAVNHEPREELIWIDDSLTDTLRLHTQLQPIEFIDNPREIIAIGNWGNYEVENSIRFTKVEDNIYRATLPVTKWQLSYQIHGITASLQPVNGTDQHYFSYDDSGHYFSVIDTSSKTVAITLNLRTYQNLDSASINPGTQIIENNELQQVIDIFSELSVYKARFTRAYYQSYLEHGHLNAMQFDFKDDLLRIQEVIFDKSSSEKVISATGLYLFDLMSNGAIPDSEAVIHTVLESMDAKSPLWNYRPFYLFAAFGAIYDLEPYIDYLEMVQSHFENRQIVSASTFLLMRAYYDSGQFNEASSMFTRLQKEFKDIDYAEWATQIFNPDTEIYPGVQAPDFSVSSLTELAEPHKLSDYSGSYLLLDFWATWCSPCIEEMPNLHKAWEQYGGDSFTILSLSFDDNREFVNGFRKNRFPMPWNHAFVEGNFESELAQKYDISGIPKIVLIDPEGKIVSEGIRLRGENLKRTLEYYLVEP